MPGPGVISAATLTAGIRTEFADTYKIEQESSAERLAPVMQLGIPSDKLTELYAYYETAPYPKRWARGDARPTGGFKSKGFNVTNLDWSDAVTWHENDRNDDQTRSLYDMAQDAGTHFGTLDERVFFQILQATSNPDLLLSIPNAPDGASLYSTTDGSGADRFGVSSGNLLTGSTMGSPADIQSDFYASVEQMAQFRNTQGQPLFPTAAVLDGMKVVVGGVHRLREFNEAFKQSRPVVIVQNVAATENVAATVPTNIIQDGNQKFVLWLTQRITTDDWFVFLGASRKKAIFQQERQALREVIQTMDNSDIARSTKEEGLYWDARRGYGVALPYMTVKINN